ncbi:hypothetical protein FRC09_014057 [Ceratobasidium sp. 395]|nr:hypothetical protein FRC09_014057 [Ceratobasidium sp. 395]
MNNWNTTPPAIDPSVLENSPGNTPFGFEPGSSVPAALVDKRPSLDAKEDNKVASILPERARAPSPSDFPAPQSFKIGTKVIGAFELVSIPEIRSHLAFLGAFARLKASVKSQKGPDVRDSADELWAIYVARAADRGLGDFDGEVRDMKEEEVPPLDVLMAWHTYLLNPRVYYEDGLRAKSKLFYIRAFPLDLVYHILNMDSFLPLDPTPKRQSQFELATGQPWTAPLNTTRLDTTTVPCPRCREGTVTEVHWVTSENTGFAQHKFKAQCDCAPVIGLPLTTHAQTMMVRALCDDIISVRASLVDQSDVPKIFMS